MCHYIFFYYFFFFMYYYYLFSFYPRHSPTPTTYDPHPRPTTHTHDPRPLPTTHDPRHLATLSKNARRTTYDVRRTTHDARRTTHDPRPTTHDPPTYAISFFRLHYLHILHLSIENNSFSISQGRCARFPGFRILWKLHHDLS